MRPAQLIYLPTLECTVLERVNRFVVRIMIDGRESLAHTNNTGRLNGYLERGVPARCIEKRGGKTRYRLVAVSDPVIRDHRYALIDTWIQMKGFEKSLEQGLLPVLTGCSVKRRNPRVGESLLDYELSCQDRELYIEIKSAVQRIDHTIASYPDAPSLRGRRHLWEIIGLLEKKVYAGVVFIAGIPLVDAFTPNDTIDPVIRELLKEIRKRGGLIAGISMYYDTVKEAVVLENNDLAILL